ncbi:unnamed protein product [Cylindrotheca closterium]|uniref:Uncharacterized protein n=1 Tax=Cylindrotheca closterium TaxID=2856 RepID=A0AAD2FN05_9STRA|nr:unnamed protein product [Cylindrotheca closterium]
MGFIIHIFVVCLWLQLMILPAVQAQEDDGDFCNFDGERIPRGASVGSNFETRCGPWEEWPCFCNPDVPYQVDCPYCGFATNTPNLVKCAKHDETVSLLALSDDLGKKCTCDASDPAFPVSSCVGDFFADKCMFVVDGKTFWYANGDMVDVVNPCGSVSDYPCFCNPNLQDQLYCPYCTVTTRSGAVECLKDEEVKQFNIFRQGSQSSCVCDYSSRGNLNFPAEPRCNLPDGCAVAETNGATTFYSDGEEIRNREGICGTGYPFICDASGASIGSDNLTYPYCQIIDQSGEVQCVRDGESISLIDRFGESVRCTCRFGSLGPISDCVDSDISITTPPTRAPADSPTRAPTVSTRPLSTTRPTVILSLPPPTPSPGPRQTSSNAARPRITTVASVASVVAAVVATFQLFSQ